MNIRRITEADGLQVKDMMRVFYASDAVVTNGSEEIFQNNINSCLKENTCLNGYVFEENGDILGYAMTAGSFSTEYGRECLWIEDLYVKPQYQGLGIGKAFFEEMEKIHPGMMLCLEVEAENVNALKLYRKCGFEEMGYLEMKKIPK